MPPPSSSTSAFFSSPDLLNHLALHFTTVRHLALLSAVCRGVKEYLFGEAGGRHWTRVGKIVCGDGHQMDEDVRRMCGERYATMLEICPWVSVPRIVDLQTDEKCIADMQGVLQRRTLDCWVGVGVGSSVRTLFAHACFRGSCVGVVGGCTKTKVYSESYNLELAESFENIGSGEMKVVSNIFASKLKDSITTSWGTVAKVDDLHEWFPFTVSVVQQLLRVHDSVFAVVCMGSSADRVFGSARVFFVSYADKRILRVIKLDVRAWRSDRYFCFPPGEIWMMLGYSNPFLTYYGPHESKQRLHIISERMVHAMYGEIYNGNAQNAVDQLTALGLDICTARSPFNDDSLAEVVVKTAEDAAVFSSLLAIEPRIVTIACLKTVILLKRYDILKIIIDEGGAGVNIMQRVDAKCLSLLHLAVDSKKVGERLIGLLVSAGMDVRALDAIDPFLTHVPFDMSASIVGMLCEAGARVDVDVDGGVPLLHHWMGGLAGNYHRHIDVLVSFGYNINKRHLGRTPLMTAALSNHVQNVRKLISSGADINARDDAGKTAAELLLSSTPRALRVHLKEVLRLLNGE